MQSWNEIHNSNHRLTQTLQWQNDRLMSTSLIRVLINQ